MTFQVSKLFIQFYIFNVRFKPDKKMFQNIS